MTSKGTGSNQYDFHPPRACAGCGCGLSRRGFLRACGATVAAGLLAPAIPAGEAKPEKVRVAAVFLANSAEHEIWPYPGYDCAARQREILGLLAEGCPGVDFVPITVAQSSDLARALALTDQVDGYLVYAMTLNWHLQPVLAEVGKLGKPLLIVDEYLGGSGVFLCGLAALRRQGISAGAVSSRRPEDLVAVARLFGDIRAPGSTPASFARKCEEVYRGTFPQPGATKFREDKVSLTEIGECVRRLKESKFVSVGAGPAGQEAEYLGAKGIHVGFDEFKACYDKVDRDQAAHWGREWAQRAEQVREPTAEWLAKAGGVYLAMKELLKKHGTDSITMNCLGGFGSGQLPAYPCLGFMQLLDDGGQGVCEAMPDDSVSTLMGRILAGRAGYVSDPAIDSATHQIVYSHCMALTKPFGPQGNASPFRIRTLHNRDPRGCCAQSFLPEGYLTTTFRTNVGAKKMVIHQAKAVGNLDADRGCRTQLLGEVRGDIGKMFGQWDLFGWHRVTLYGDLKEPLMEFGRALGLDIIEEA